MADKDSKDFQGRVILTYGRSLMALTAAQSLGEKNIEVIGYDDVDMTVLNFSKYVSNFFVHASKEKDEAAYLDDLIENIKNISQKMTGPTF